MSTPTPSSTHKPTSQTPQIHITASISTPIYTRSSPLSLHPRITVITTLLHPSILTIETRGQTDSGTILDQDFRAEHFEFFDLTTSEPVIHELFPGTCDPGDELFPDVVVELRAGVPIVTERVLEDVSPLSDPARYLETGHRYRLTLKPQRLRCWAQSVEELFGGKDYLGYEDTPEAMEVLLTCEDRLKLEVEA